MQYSAVIRTLGKAGEKYQQLLSSLVQQTFLPAEIIVYLAEGYEKPKETGGCERYVYVKKGMVAQRAMKYEEASSEYLLFLDDDVFLPPTAVETLFRELSENRADVISPYVFPNHTASFRQKIVRTITGKERPRFFDSKWGFKILSTTGFSYNNQPIKNVYLSQSNAGPCFLIKKETFLNIHFEEELWLDQAYYSLPEDQVMYFKMFRKGLIQLTSFDSGIVHLDAGSTLAPSREREEKLVYSEWRNKMIFWHRFLFLPSPFIKRISAVVGFGYSLSVQIVKYSLLRLLGKKILSRAFFNGLSAGRAYLMTDEYKSLPLV